MFRNSKSQARPKRIAQIFQFGFAVIAKDDQPGHTGVENVHTLYRFKVASHDPSAKYLLQAEIKADGGTDSYGDISIVRD